MLGPSCISGEQIADEGSQFNKKKDEEMSGIYRQVLSILDGTLGNNPRENNPENSSEVPRKIGKRKNPDVSVSIA